MNNGVDAPVFLIDGADDLPHRDLISDVCGVINDSRSLFPEALKVRHDFAIAQHSGNFPFHQGGSHRFSTRLRPLDDLVSQFASCSGFLAPIGFGLWFLGAPNVYGASFQAKLNRSGLAQ